MKTNVILSCETDITIEFYDVDSMDMVWHGNYVKYLEQARCRLFEKLGYDYSCMLAHGHAWPIVDLKIKYIKPAVFCQKIRIYSELVEWEHRLKVRYIIMDAESGLRLTKAQTTQMVVDLESGETLFEAPEILKQKVQAIREEQ